MTTTICANCGGPRPEHPNARPDEPLYCSITCYRAGTGLDDPDTGDGRTWDPQRRRYTTPGPITKEAPPTTVTPANKWGISTSNTGESRRAASQFLVDDLGADERALVTRLCGRLYRGLGEDLGSWWAGQIASANGSQPRSSRAAPRAPPAG
jgi:hypothetical protein